VSNIRNRDGLGVPAKKANEREDHGCFFRRCIFSSLNPRYQRRIAIKQVNADVAADVTSTKKPSVPSIT